MQLLNSKIKLLKKLLKPKLFREKYIPTLKIPKFYRKRFSAVYDRRGKQSSTIKRVMLKPHPLYGH